MPELMAEWMVSQPSSDSYIRQSLGSFFSPYPDCHEVRVGRHCHYSIPAFRLEGTDSTFVLFELDPVPRKVVKRFERIMMVETAAGKQRVSLRALDNHPELAELVPHSAPHQHPGDELLYVLEGQVFVELDDTGIRTRLKKSDYIHFESEVPHTVWNVSTTDSAKLLVIRFFQLSRVGSRRRREENLRFLMDELETPLEVLGESEPRGNPAGHGLRVAKTLTDAGSHLKEIYTRYARIESWLRSTQQLPSSRVTDGPRQILDFVGLSHLLHLMILTDSQDGSFPRHLLRKHLDPEYVHDAEHGDLTAEESAQLIEGLRKLADIVAADDEAKREGFSAQDVFRYFRGQPPEKRPPSVRDLEIFGGHFRIPRVLFDNVLVPPVPRCVVVRDTDRDRIMPPPYTQLGDTGHLSRYRLPCRALASSDIAITFLQLDPGGRSSWNHHMGFEFIYCLTGGVKLLLEDSASNEPKTIPCTAGEYIHYRSRFRHQIKNDGDEVSDLLVIRFNELDGSER